MNTAPYELSPSAEAPSSLAEQRPVDPHSIRAAKEKFESLVIERPADAAEVPTPAASALPTQTESPELDEVRRVHGEEGVRQVLGAVEQVQRHVAGERQKLAELIPEWQDNTTRALELPEIIRFAKARGATDEQIAEFNLRGTAAELKNWRDFWRASHAGRRTDDRVAPEARDRGHAPAPARRRQVVREPVEIPAHLSLHEARRLLEKTDLVD